MKTLAVRLGYAALLISLAVPASAKTVTSKKPNPKFDESLRETLARGCSGTQKVIVRTDAGTRAGLSRSLRSHGSKVNGEFPSIDAVAAEVACEDLDTLAGFSTTKSVSVDAPVAVTAINSNVNVKGPKPKAPVDPGVAAASLQSKLFQTLLSWTEFRDASYLGTVVNSGSSYNTASYLTDMGLKGVAGGVGIGVIDSGIAPVADFDSRITAFYDFTGDDIQAVAPSDQFGHGTHVAGLIASKYVGVAPGARLVGLKVLNSKGKGSTSNLIRAIEFAILNKKTLNLQILNLSLGHPIFESATTDPLVLAVERAVRAGYVVVVSAGNFGMNPATGVVGYAGIASPGNAPSAITVGAVKTFDTVSRDDDRVAPYSSRGPSWYDGFAKPDVVAPGDDVLSVAAPNSYLRALMEARGNVGEYMRLSGTSMSAGVTSGLVALLMDVNPKLTPNALKAVLEFTAIPVKNAAGQPENVLTQGVGQVNGGGAGLLAWAINGTAAVGQKWLTATMTIVPSTQIGSSTYNWSSAIIWGDHVARGSGIMAEQRSAWQVESMWGGFNDDNIVWGNSLFGDDNIVWGNGLFDLFDDNIVWGNSIVWGLGLNDDNIVWGNGFFDDNIVWGNNVVWGNNLIGLSFFGDDNIVWGNNIVWGATPFDGDNIVWGNLFDDNIVWGNSEDKVLSNTVSDVLGSVGNVLQWTGNVTATASNDRARRTAVRKGVR